MLTIYHNPRCSKSRAALALIEEKGHTPTVVLYLDSRLSKKKLNTLLTQLNMTPRELIRTSEAAYKELNLANPELTKDALLDAMLANPKLIERPIVSNGKKAYLGRPTENILPLL